MVKAVGVLMEFKAEGALMVKAEGALMEFMTEVTVAGAPAGETRVLGIFVGGSAEQSAGVAIFVAGSGVRRGGDRMLWDLSTDGKGRRWCLDDGCCRGEWFIVRQ